MNEGTATPLDPPNYMGCDCGGQHRTCGGRAWCLDCSEWCYAEPDMQCEIAVLRMERVRLRSALTKFGNHKTLCAAMWFGDCECGWADTRVALGLVEEDI